MCLEYIKTKNLPVIKEGFKVFKRKRLNGKWKLFGVHRNKCEYNKRKWKVDLEIKKIFPCSFLESNISYYLTGFHCFIHKKDALKYCEDGEVVHRVLVKNITAIGNQGNYPCFAAREIYIMEEVS